MRIPKDNREKVWSHLEKNIQVNAGFKDKSFELKGKWKRFVRNQQGYRVFSVDAVWIRRNLCFYFGHGGHGLVHEFIPMGEIWITSYHYNEEKDKLFRCPCKTKKKNQKCSKHYFDSTVLHEITECNEMKKGKNYWVSHQIALQAERRSHLLRDPFDDR